MSEALLLNVCVGLTLWLLPCAIQDYRTRHVSNWLTVPPFLLAWPVALLNGAFGLTPAVFVGVYLAWALGAGLGPADGKIAVALAASAPPVLLAGILVQAGAFLVLRLRGKPRASIPGAVGFHAGGVVATLVLAVGRIR
ncbi:MAG: hypothetical protein CVU38_07575 [Chloroflexi bacterium HGW-Chloroflexi-1]|nr:MAG: hypothetical protein CVU38_07575 [Chloroflexi bacterium HGW-Chloroflexi-1]